jgi:hypothetical protein
MAVMESQKARIKLNEDGIDFAASTGLTEKQVAGLKKIDFRPAYFVKQASNRRSVTALTETQEGFRQRIELEVSKVMGHGNFHRTVDMVEVEVPVDHRERVNAVLSK